VNQSLHALLKDIVPLDKIPEILVENLKLDSRSTQAGDLFFAYPGSHLDSRQFISQAIDQGASVVLRESDATQPDVMFQQDVPIINVPDLSHWISLMASRFYDNPSQHLKVIAVTGTNGKTSTSCFLAQALQKLGKKAGIIGTVGYGVVGELTTQSLTTPDPITVQSILYDLWKEAVEYVVMEASSHALSQYRVAGISFDMGIFTNLTRDHLDYHGDMTAYADAKHRLFEMSSLKTAIFNVDDPIGAKWFDEFKSRDLTVRGFSLEKRLSTDVVYAEDISLHSDGIDAVIIAGKQQAQLHIPLLGRFNLANVLAVITALLSLDYPLVDILGVLKTVQSVPGRMQLLGGGASPLVVIDFSHTPDALEQALKAIREHCKGQLFCIFGCGGDRDRGKRPLMAKIAEQYADYVIVTDDNVRFEDANQIMDDIIAGFDQPDVVQREHDRKRAIQMALDQAKQGDIVLLAGKGHEHYQIIGDQYLLFNEAEIVLEMI